MIYPGTRLRYINDEIGYGVFATQLIPKDMVVYIGDSLELEITPEAYSRQNPVM